MNTTGLHGILCICILTTLSACSSNDDDDKTEARASTIVWEPCTDNISLDCASVDVPMDYGDENSETIPIGLRRRAADVAATPRLLLLNPGGPGAPGSTLLNDLVAANNLPQRMLNNFDIVGFDPRGTGNSNPIDCTEFSPFETSLYPGNDEDILDLIMANTLSAEQCVDKHGDYLQHLGSNNVVRDMEEIRKAYAIDKIDFFGASYGSRLGALYLQNHPETSGAFVLDGVTLPNASTSLIARGSVNALQRNLEQLLNACVTVEQQCDPAMLQQQLEQRIDFFINALDSGTLPAEFESFEALQNEAILLLQTTLEVSADLSLINQAINPLFNYLQTNDIQFLAQFNASQSLTLEDDSNPPNNDQVQGGPNATATIAVQCADDAERPTLESLNALLRDMNNDSDIFAEVGLRTAVLCAGWPAAISPVEPIASSTAPRSLLIGGTTDTSTPIEWLAPMRDAIGGISITSSHFGHTVVFDSGNDCIDSQVTEFFLTQTAPVNLEC